MPSAEGDGGDPERDPETSTLGNATEDASEEPNANEHVDSNEGAAENSVALYKLDDDGATQPALSQVGDEPNPDDVASDEEQLDGAHEHDNFGSPIPKVLALGMSPDGSVYVLFEYAFQYQSRVTGFQPVCRLGVCDEPTPVAHLTNRSPNAI